jgi:hypothetical protein
VLQDAVLHALADQRRRAILRLVRHTELREDDENVPPGSTTVEVTLARDANGTHVRLVHRGLQTQAMREQHWDGWEHYLARLSVAAAGGDPEPGPNANPSQGGA